MRRSQIFDLLSSFPKLVVNIFILRNLIVGWGRELLRRGIVLCIRSIDLEEVLIARGSRIYQNKSWYYLESFQNSKVRKLLSAITCQFFCQKFQLRCLTGSIKLFQ